MSQSITKASDVQIQHFKNVVLKPAQRLRGEIEIPPDKSIAHRAVFLNGLADGEAEITNFLEGVDTRDSLHSLKNLGVGIHYEPHVRVMIRGIGANGLTESPEVLDVGTSATTMRFLLGLVAPEPILTIITGTDRTRQRPMERITNPLQQMGATVFGRKNGQFAPLAIYGGDLQGIHYTSEVSSGEVKTSLLLAGLRAKRGITCIETPLASRDHTERMLKAMGATIHVEENGCRVSVEPMSKPLSPINMRIPGEISAAVYWIVLGLVHPDSDITIKSVCVNPSRTGLFDVLKKMGADMEIIPHPGNNLEPIADIRVRSSRLNGTVVSPELYPRMADEFPGFALAAALAEGETVIQGADDLRNKKTNRIADVVEEYRKLGAIAHETKDGMRFEGCNRLKGAHCTSHGDHRLGNSLAAAALVATGETYLENTLPITKTSYPTFWSQVQRVCGPDAIVRFDQ